jgi:BirA family biotin operon repressor/biotin-[acetyl-CoA-carboxylase] ligase
MRKRWIKPDSLTSTNTYVSDLLKQGTLEEGTVVIADYQDSGRGQGDHSWLSEPGENLLMSILLFPAFLSAEWQFHLSRVVSLALCDVLEVLGVEAVIKWPNDILGSKGKIAGILIEHGISAGKITHTIAGIGLNLNQTEFPDFPMAASSLRLETGRRVIVEEVAELVEDRIMIRYRDLRDGLGDRLEMEYLERLYLAGVPAVFSSAEGTIEGIIRGVNDFGELLVEHQGEIRSFGHGTLSMEPESGRA